MSKAFTRLAAGLAVILSGLSWAGLAQADRQHAYVGLHPLSADPNDGFCYIDAPHVHAIAPSTPVLYVDRDDYNYFIGDPVAYGYEGQSYPYQGHHPIAVDVVLHGDDPGTGDVLCVIDGPHFHYFEPAPRLEFEMKGGAYVFVGDPPGRELSPSRQEVAVVNSVYADIEYARPIVDVRVAPPVTFVAAPVAVEVDARPIRSAQVVDRGPVRAGIRAGVEVRVPVPSLEVRVGGPAVVVHERGRRHRHYRGKHKKYKRYKKHKKYKGKRRRGRSRYYRKSRRRR